ALYRRSGAALPIRSPPRQAWAFRHRDRGPTEDVALVQSRVRVRHAGPGQGGRLELISYQTRRPRELLRLPARGLSFEEPHSRSSVLTRTQDSGLQYHHFTTAGAVETSEPDSYALNALRDTGHRG